MQIYLILENKKEMNKNKTSEEVENFYQKILDKLKQDPLYELRQEFGMMLFKHINDFTEEEYKRYNELKELLK